MSLINRTGTFRGKPVATGISESSGGYPQFQMSLVAKELWDQDEKVWVDWSQYEENEIIAYLVLVGSAGKALLNCHQLMKALNWSGESFSQLNETDYSETIIQFRVEESIYEGNTSFKVTWIDHVDSEPGRTIQKLDAEDIKKLDAKYATVLRDLSGGKKPKKPVEKPVVPAKKQIETVVPEEPEVTKKAKPKKINQQPTTPPVPTVPPSKLIGKQQAWEAVVEAKTPDLTDDRLNEIWLREIEDLGGEENFEPGDWERLKNIVIEQIKDDLPF